MGNYIIMNVMMLVMMMMIMIVNAKQEETTNYYWMFSREDVPNSNISQMTGATIEQLQDACNQLDACAGFTLDGWLKNSTETPVYAPATTLYVKMSIPQPASKPFLIPMPSSFTFGASVVGVASAIKYTAVNPSSDLDAAFIRLQNLIFDHPVTSPKPYQIVINELIVSVKDVNVSLQYGVDESYTLNIPNDATSATLTANTVYGAYQGMQTFSQLVMFNYDNRSYQIAVAPVEIIDAPRFSHRGMMIDTARHYEPLHTIQLVIDSISYAKYNVLHWHMVDQQSFPFESLSSPNLWKGAYSSQERYTQEDVASIVEYARQRGIRVIVEFDMPGHADSWCIGYPDLCPSTTCTTPLSPSSNVTWDVISGLIGELTGEGSEGAGLFPDNFLHVGGDEVNTDCWTESPEITAWMKSQNYSTSDAYAYFVSRVHNYTFSRNRDPINWEEVFTLLGPKLDPRTIIQIWFSDINLPKVVAAGYRAIYSNQYVWYLNWVVTPWQTMYLADPVVGITDPDQQALVIGGEACLWGEWVDTSDLFQTMWPRAAAAAERLWSPAEWNITTEFLPRLEAYRCLLNRRGIAAAPTNNAEPRTAPPNPDSCYVQ